MHRKNIFHIDIKPTNIMFLDKDQNIIKIIDFDFAIHKHDNSQTT